MPMPLLPLLQLAAAVTIAQPPVPPTNVYHGRQNQTSVPVTRTAVEPKVDGILSDDAWKGAALLTGFSQYAPVDRQPAADSTEVLVTYSDHAMFIAIRAFESHGPVVATLSD